MPCKFEAFQLMHWCCTECQEVLIVNDQPNRVTCSELLFLCSDLPTYMKSAHKEVSLQQRYMTFSEWVAQISPSNIIKLLNICWLDSMLSSASVSPIFWCASLWLCLLPSRQAFQSQVQIVTADVHTVNAQSACLQCVISIKDGCMGSHLCGQAWPVM